MKRKKVFKDDFIVSLIIVTQNDEDIIEKRLREIRSTLVKLKTNFEILIVDNNSQDSTVKKIKKLTTVMRYTRILVLSKKYDTEIALTAGLDNCVGDYAILFNLYTDPTKMISIVLEKLVDGNDAVIARAKKRLGNYTPLSRLLLWFVEKISTHGIYYRYNYLTGLHRKAINSIIRTRRKSRNMTYINTLIGYRKETLEYTPLRRYKHKVQNENFVTLSKSIFDTVISNSFRPIRLVSFTGMVFSALFLIYVLIIVILVLVFGLKHLAPQGWITVATVLGTMFFLLFSLLSIISEYIIRILDETRDEPFYFVAEEINKSVLLPKRRKKLNIV